MLQTVRIEGHDVEVQMRFRVELGEWEASLRHPIHNFTVTEWAATPEFAVNAAQRALHFYAREMEQVKDKRAPSPRAARA